MPLGVSEKVQDFSRVFQGCYGFESLLLALIAATRAEGELAPYRIGSFIFRYYSLLAWEGNDL